MNIPQKVDVKSCKKVPPPHPCDPQPPCDPLKEPKGDCVKPFLCYEKLRNPEEDHMTRCRPGASIGVRICVPPPKPHPCDPKPPCKTLPPPKKLPCDDVPLCWEKIKNPETPGVKRVVCTDSKGRVREQILKRPLE